MALRYGLAGSLLTALLALTATAEAAPRDRDNNPPGTARWPRHQLGESAGPEGRAGHVTGQVRALPLRRGIAQGRTAG